jgi:transposase
VVILLELTPIYKGNVVGLDIHQKHVTACALIVDPDGQNATPHFREFGTFIENLIEMAEWIQSLNPDIVVMESTGVYWSSPYRILCGHGIIPTVVNARHVKNVPGRKTDTTDSHWLAILGRAGLLKKSFVPSPEFADLRCISRQTQKVTGTLASEKNRMNKILVDAGIRLSVVVSDPHGVSARQMTECLINGGTPEEALKYASDRLKASRQDILLALNGHLSESRCALLRSILEHIRYLERQQAKLNQQLLSELKPYQKALDLVQTIPGLNEMAAAMLLVEIGADMSAFGSASRLAAWTGLCPGNNESAGKRKSGKTRKGNRWVRRIMCEAAQAAVKSVCMLQAKYKSLVVTRGRKRALMAVAHKMIRIVYAVLSKEVPYKDTTVNYEEIMVKRNAPRWINALKKYNIFPLGNKVEEVEPSAPKKRGRPKKGEEVAPSAPKKRGRPKKVA